MKNDTFGMIDLGKSADTAFTSFLPGMKVLDVGPLLFKEVSRQRLYCTAMNYAIAIGAQRSDDVQHPRVIF